MATSEVESAVRRYYAVVADLASTEAELVALLHPEARFVEHPNAITPAGAVRDVAGTVAGFRAGKALLREQAIEIRDVLVAGNRAAVRATWSGVVGPEGGPIPAGTRIRAELGGFLTVAGGKIVEHETYDCYPPFSATS